MITFEGVLKRTNDHTELTSKHLFRILFELFIIASGISFFLDSMLYLSLSSVTIAVMLIPFIVTYFFVFSTLDSMSRSKEVYKSVMRMKPVLLGLSLLLIAFGLVLIIVFR